MEPIFEISVKFRTKQLCFQDFLRAKIFQNFFQPERGPYIVFQKWRNENFSLFNKILLLCLVLSKMANS